MSHKIKPRSEIQFLGLYSAVFATAQLIMIKHYTQLRTAYGIENIIYAHIVFTSKLYSRSRIADTPHHM